MIQMRAVNVSYADNHQVHIETHAQIMDLPQYKMYPKVVQELFTQHMKDHVSAMQAITSTPGLVPNDQISMPNQPNLQPSKVQPVQPKPGTNPNQAPGIKPGSEKKAPMQPQSKPVAPAVSTTPPKTANIKTGKKIATKLKKSPKEE